MKRSWRRATKQVFETGACQSLKYRGIPIGKSPLDLWIYQEAIEEIQPGLIIEFGTQWGGSALWFAHQLDLLPPAGSHLDEYQRKVFTVEKNPLHRHAWPTHPRIEYRRGRITDDSATFVRIDELCREASIRDIPVMIVEDSSHRYRHVLRELTMYAHLVTLGSYYVVEDGVLDHVLARRGEGAYRAIQQFMKNENERPDGPRFEIDKRREKFGVTFHPSGWLKRIR